MPDALGGDRVLQRLGNLRLADKIAEASGAVTPCNNDVLIAGLALWYTAVIDGSGLRRHRRDLVTGRGRPGCRKAALAQGYPV